LDLSLTRPRSWGLAAAVGLALALWIAPQALGQETTPPPNLSNQRVIQIASHDPKVIAERQENGHLVPSPTLKPGGTWEVGFFKGDKELALVMVSDSTAQITESWTGYQVAWQMARGYPGAFGRKINAPYVWLPLCAVFLLGLLDYRRLGRLAHLDLLVLLGFGVSHYFFNQGNIGVSVPLTYPVLLYLLARMLWIGFRGRGAGLRPSLTTGTLAILLIFLVAFRVALNVADSNVIDVGYAGVVGADRVEHSEPIYGDNAFPDDNQTGDTYGPANYYAYVPFELILPWSGAWDDLPAAHAATVAFDLITLAGLFFLGRRIRPGPAGTRLGTILAFGWAACPYTAFALESNSNDILVSALLVGALLLIDSVPGRAVMIGVASLAKFAPLALAPLFAAGVRTEVSEPKGRLGRLLAMPRPAPTAIFAVALALTAAVLLAGPAVDPGLATFWNRTVATQTDRSSPFSVWGQVPSLGWLRTLVEIAVAGLAMAVAFVPRRRDLRQVAALGAAIMIGVELTLEHWFYLYIPWFLPFLLLALALGDGVANRPFAGSSASATPAEG
jgi:hypothetical protein